MIQLRTAAAKKFRKVSPAGEEWTLTVRFPKFSGERLDRTRLFYTRDGARVSEGELTEAEKDFVEDWEEEIFLLVARATGSDIQS